MKLGEDARQRFVDNEEKPLCFEKGAVFLDGQVAVIFVQHLVGVGRGFDVFLVFIDFGIHVVDQLVALEFGRAVNVFIHQIGDGAFGGAKAAIHMIGVFNEVLGNINGRIVEIICAPKTGGFLFQYIVGVQVLFQDFQFAVDFLGVIVFVGVVDGR